MPDDDVRGPGSPANGHHTNGSARPVPPFARRLPDDGDVQAPIDLVAVQADDELVNALGARPVTPPAGTTADGPGPEVVGPSIGRGGPGERDTDDRLVAMLAAWRAEIDAEPIPELVDLDTAVAAVVSGMAQNSSAARRRRAGRLRQLAPLVAAAAIIVATVTGVGLGSQNAVPGDTLWPIQKVVNPERAESVEAKVKVESRLETVRTALKSGDTATAARELDAIRTEIPAVRGQEGKPDLVQEQDFLAAKLADTKPGQPVDLSTPPKSNPAARSTGAPPPPPPPADSSATVPSVSASAPKSPPSEADKQKSAPDRDRSKDAVAPAAPDGSAPAAPPERPAPDVTSVPVPQPEPKPQPAPPGKDEGKPDPTSDPGPVDQPPPSGTDSGPAAGGGGDSGNAGDGHGADNHDAGGGSSDTTTAAGAAGANIDTTATDTTS